MCGTSSPAMPNDWWPTYGASATPFAAVVIDARISVYGTRFYTVRDAVLRWVQEQESKATGGADGCP